MEYVANAFTQNVKGAETTLSKYDIDKLISRRFICWAHSLLTLLWCVLSLLYAFFLLFIFLSWSAVSKCYISNYPALMHNCYQESATCLYDNRTCTFVSLFASPLH